jgi:broad specificity phosphatase PhoE
MLSKAHCFAGPRAILIQLVMVAHGGTWAAYLAILLGLDLGQRQPWAFDNASVSIVTLGGTRPRISLLNDTCHLNHMA